MSAAVALLGIAVIMVESAAMDVAESLSIHSVLSGRHIIYAAIAVAAMVAASHVDLNRLARTTGLGNPLPWFFIGALALAGVTLIPGVGLTINGARRWLRIGAEPWAIMFQPSEILKLACLLILAWWCARRRGVMHRFFIGLAPALVIAAIACTVVVVEDFGTAVLMAASGAVLLLAGGARLWQMAMLVPPAAAAVVAAVIARPHRIERLQTFLDPFADMQGAGYQVTQGLVAIAQGGWFGRGIGAGLQKFDYLPTDTSDMIFAVICEETGLVGAAVVIGLYVTLLAAGLAVIRRSEPTFGRLVALGVMASIGVQAAINLAVVTVVVPTKGMALPLLSAGGTGWIVTAFAIGLVASLDRAHLYEQLQQPDQISSNPSQAPVAELPALTAAPPIHHTSASLRPQPAAGHSEGV